MDRVFLGPAVYYHLAVRYAVRLLIPPVQRETFPFAIIELIEIRLAHFSNCPGPQVKQKSLPYETGEFFLLIAAATRTIHTILLDLPIFLFGDLPSTHEWGRCRVPCSVRRNYQAVSAQEKNN